MLLLGRVMIWKEMFTIGQATCTPGPQLLKHQASQQATSSLNSFTVEHVGTMNVPKVSHLTSNSFSFVT